MRSRCYCCDPVERWTSWTPLNPGRMFIGYPNFQDELKDCKYFRCVSPPLPCQWYATLLYNVHVKNRRIFGNFLKQPVWNLFGNLMEKKPPQQVEELTIQHENQGGIWKSMTFYVFRLLLCLAWLYWNINNIPLSR